MSVRAISGTSALGHLQPQFQNHLSVTRAVFSATRVAWSIFARTVLPLFLLTTAVLVISPFFSGVFNDQPVSEKLPSQEKRFAASAVPSITSNVPVPPKKSADDKKSRLKVEYVESPLMAWSRQIHEDTSTMRSQLNAPLPTGLDPTSYPAINKRLYDYQQSLYWDGTFNKAQISFVLAVVVFVIAIPWMLLTSNLVRPRQVVSVVAMAVLAILVAAMPLSVMSTVQASKAYIVDKSFRGDAFDALQYDSQQELVEKPAAHVALGPVGLTPKGIEYITSLHNADPVAEEDIVTFSKVRPNLVESNAVATFSLLRAVIDADLQRPFMMLAVGLEAAINVVLNPLTVVVVLILMIISTISLSFKRHVRGFLGMCAVLYAALAGAVLLITISAIASLWLARFLSGANIGPLTTALGAVGALGIMWVYRCAFVEVVKRTKWVIVAFRSRKALPAYQSKAVLTGTIVDSRRKSRRQK